MVWKRISRFRKKQTSQVQVPLLCRISFVLFPSTYRALYPVSCQESGFVEFREARWRVASFPELTSCVASVLQHPARTGSYRGRNQILDRTVAAGIWLPTQKS